MPVNKVKGGYRWGEVGKVYKTYAEAAAQGKAIEESMKARGKTEKNTKKK
jgi:hypothetical protein